MLPCCREIGEEERTKLKEKVLADVGKWLERFDCIVIGPGLGRDSILLVRSIVSAYENFVFCMFGR